MAAAADRRVVILGEVGRFAGGAGGGVKAADDLLAGAALLALGIAGARARHALHAAGWALFAGVMLATLGITLHEWLADPGKPGAAIYLPLLTALTLLGAGVSLWWSRPGP